MNKKKILCCASLVKDLLIAMAFDDSKKLDKIMESEEAKEFVRAADALAELLK